MKSFICDRKTYTWLRGNFLDKGYTITTSLNHCWELKMNLGDKTHSYDIGRTFLILIFNKCRDLSIFRFAEIKSSQWTYRFSTASQVLCRVSAYLIHYQHVRWNTSGTKLIGKFSKKLQINRLGCKWQHKIETRKKENALEKHNPLECFVFVRIYLSIEPKYTSICTRTYRV